MNKAYLLLLTLGIACTNQVKKTDSANESNKLNVPVESSIETTPASTEIVLRDSCEMITIEGGNFLMGRFDSEQDEAPQHEAKVATFMLDKYPVTVAQFRKFIEATGFKTEAEKFGDAGVLNAQNNWELIKGATWKYPQGPGKDKAIDNHPVTQVSWNDAVAYAKWAGKRLPTEAEWEFAAKNGQYEAKLYPWGDEAFPGGAAKANIYLYTEVKVPDDGFTFTSPVNAFPAYPNGLCDMIGNVWEWTSSTYGPYDPNMPFRKDQTVKVIRGGAFTYDQALLNGFTTSFRGEITAETSLFNMGFRCAMDAK